MTSGKSLYLCNKYVKYSIKQKKKVLSLNHSEDTRYGSNNICAHNGVSVPAKSVSTLMDLDISDYDIILLDEGQFFPDLMDFINKIESTNISIYISGLKSDIWDEKFGWLIDLIPRASNVKCLKAYCDFCTKHGSYNRRKGQLINRGVKQIDNGQYYIVCSDHKNVYL